MFPFGKIISGIPWQDARPIKIASTALALDIDMTSAATSGDLTAVDIDMTNSAAGTVNDRALTVDFTMGANCAGPYAGYFRVTPGAYQVGGLGAAFGIEMVLPTVAITTGEYHGMTIDIACTQNSAIGAGKHSFIKVETWGDSTAKTAWDTGANLLYINGPTAGADKLISLASQTARVNLAGTTRYMVLSQMQDGLGLGLVGGKMVLTVGLHAIDIHCTSAATDSSSQVPISSNHTMTGIGATGGRAEFNCTFQPGSSGAAGGWTNALKANFTFGSNATGGTGLHTALTAEMSVPNATVSGGEFACLDMQMGIPASHIPQAKGLSFFTMNSYTTPTVMDDSGTLFALYGVTGADNKMFDDSVALNNPQIEGMLRIRILNNYWYIPLCDDPDGAA